MHRFVADSWLLQNNNNVFTTSSFQSVVSSLVVSFCADTPNATLQQHYSETKTKAAAGYKLVRSVF